MKMTRRKYVKMISSYDEGIVGHSFPIFYDIMLGCIKRIIPPRAGELMDLYYEKSMGFGDV